jgi:YegS/Rv2252/BmrU family lipid kinase
MTRPTWLVVNPTAGSGRARRSAQELASRLPDARLLETEGPGDAVRIARQAREEGVGVLVAVGGDGTIQQCVAGLCLDSSGAQAASDTVFSVLPAGTGGDFRKTFGWNNSVDQAEARLRAPEISRIDVGRVSYQATEARETTAFANILTFGLGGLTDRLVESGPKWIGGRAAFFIGAVRATLVHQPVPIELRLDGKVVETASFSNVAVCNARFAGGGMEFAPEADPRDGLFDVVTFEMSKIQTLSLSGSIYRGAHLSKAGVRHYRCRHIEARTTRPGESLLDVDGEQPGALPLEIDLLPGALHLLV